VRSLTLNRSTVVTLFGISVLASVTIWFLLPAITFGGRYHHRLSHSVYEFRDGRFYENGKDLGHYSVHHRTVVIYLDQVQESIDATIGWYTISMPLPKFGQSLLIREDCITRSPDHSQNTRVDDAEGGQLDPQSLVVQSVGVLIGSPLSIAGKLP